MASRPGSSRPSRPASPGRTEYTVKEPLRSEDRFTIDFITNNNNTENGKKVVATYIFKKNGKRENILLFPTQIHTVIDNIPPHEYKIYKNEVDLLGSQIIFNTILKLNSFNKTTIISELKNERINLDIIDNNFFIYIKKLLNYYLYNYNNNFSNDIINEITILLNKLIIAIDVIFLSNSVIKDNIKKQSEISVPKPLTDLTKDTEQQNSVMDFLFKIRNNKNKFGNALKSLIDLYFVKTSQRPESPPKPPPPAQQTPKPPLPTQQQAPKPPLPTQQQAPKPPPALPPPKQKTKPPPENVATKTKRKIVGYRVNCKGGRKTTGSRKTRS